MKRTKSIPYFWKENDRVGHLTIVQSGLKKKYGTKWFKAYICRCDCGQTLFVTESELKKGQKGCRKCRAIRVHNEKRILRGYVLLYRPTHHRAQKHGANKGYVFEHIVVAENMIGRKLLQDEVVHHKDRVRSNNEASNLQVMKREEHNRMHSKEQHRLLHHILQGEKRCKKCGTLICGHGLCKKCDEERRRANIPSRETLIPLLENISAEKVAKKFGVTGNAVRKWAKMYCIKHRDLRKRESA